jgi:hypothetical protein
VEVLPVYLPSRAFYRSAVQIALELLAKQARICKQCPTDVLGTSAAAANLLRQVQHDVDGTDGTLIPNRTRPTSWLSPFNTSPICWGRLRCLAVWPGPKNLLPAPLTRPCPSGVRGTACTGPVRGLGGCTCDGTSEAARNRGRRFQPSFP